jgi:hypothetical protein
MGATDLAVVERQMWLMRDHWRRLTASTEYDGRYFQKTDGHWRRKVLWDLSHDRHPLWTLAHG